jgi:type IV fimbrial biogenesis protein FimT
VLKSVGPARARRGFTLIELLVTVAVLAVALTAVAPAFTQQIANYRVRAAAEGIVVGLNEARSEAVRRNSAVSFTLDSAGAGWTIAQVNPAATLQVRNAGDVGTVVTTSSTTSRAVTFTPTGMVDTSGTRLTQATVASAVPGTDTRRVDIFGGGLIRICDPATTTTDDPRRC